MKLIIDTHVLLWFTQGSPHLPDMVKAIVEEADNEVHVSIASYWEVAIKQKHKPAEMPWTASVQALERLAILQDINTFAITTDAIEHTKELPMVHRDPFDRIIAATAVTTGMRLVSSDEHMDLFVVDRIWAKM